jgi:hypothetical protein
VTDRTKVKIDHADLWPMLLSAVRYALGRRSYVVGEAYDWCLSYERHLTQWQRAQIAREIREYFRLFPCNEDDIRATWERTAAMLEASQ